ncbi:hypothetical protein M0802_009922 [Mischocyttarus mexicanus]|nr:hypothetical protein M0802_009922 [Mischocyttarus mexicanus]
MQASKQASKQVGRQVKEEKGKKEKDSAIDDHDDDDNDDEDDDDDDGVRLSWLNTGQIYCMVDAFGPLQPAVVDIRLLPPNILRTSSS